MFANTKCSSCLLSRVSGVRVPAGAPKQYPDFDRIRVLLFLSETPVFLGFSAFQGRSRILPGPAFFAFMGFTADPSETWVRWIFLRFVGFMGRFVGFVLGFVGLMECSLIFREVRWICPGFVVFMGCSLASFRSLFLSISPATFRKRNNS